MSLATKSSDDAGQRRAKAVLIGSVSKRTLAVALVLLLCLLRYASTGGICSNAHSSRAYTYVFSIVPPKLFIQTQTGPYGSNKSSSAVCQSEI